MEDNEFNLVYFKKLMENSIDTILLKIDKDIINNSIINGSDSEVLQELIIKTKSNLQSKIQFKFNELVFKKLKDKNFVEYLKKVNNCKIITNLLKKNKLLFSLNDLPNNLQKLKILNDKINNINSNFK